MVTNRKNQTENWKSCLSSAWETRLQELLAGLAIAAISTGIILGVLLTRPSTNSTASTEATSSASDSNNHRIQQWLPNAASGTTVAGVTGVWGFTDSLLDYPRAVYGDSQQNLYIADNNGISIWSLGATVGNRVPGSTGIGIISGLYVDKNGNLYASSISSYAVRMWTPTATASTIVAGGNGYGYSSSQLTFIYSLTVDSSTNTIYVANSQTNTIIAGSNVTFGGAGFLLNYPRDVKCDQYGNLYVAGSNNNRILLFCQNPSSTSGRIIAGYHLSHPESIPLDFDLNLYVLSSNIDQVQKYTRIV